MMVEPREYQDESQLRPVAAKRAAKWLGHSHRFHDSADSLRKWIVASCLSVNGTSLLATMGFDEIGARSQFYASMWFFAGVCAAIVYPILYVPVITSAGNLFHDAASEFERYADFGGDLDQEKTLDELAKTERKGKLVDAFGYSSFVFFVIGALIVANVIA
jgi:hypothetical protein